MHSSYKHDGFEDIGSLCYKIPIMQVSYKCGGNVQHFPKHLPYTRRWDVAKILPNFGPMWNLN